MDKNKFWLGGRLFNTASPRLGAPTQRKARPQDGRPNATQGTSARWVPQRNARHVCKLGTPTHVRNANTRPVHTSASWAPQRNVEQGTSARWAPKSNTRHVRKLGAPTQRKARPQVGRPNGPQPNQMHVRNTNARHVRTSATQTQGTSVHPQVGCRNTTKGTSARWSPKQKTHPQRKRPHKGALG
jgi:hypothetical protein